MTQTRWTPGPWYAENSSVINEDDEIVTSIVLGGVLRGDSQEDYATARLIAAAPLMYDALDSVHKLIAKGALTGFNPHVGHWAEDLFASQRQLADALRTARGETQEKQK